MSNYRHFDVIVIGAGHAGCEATLAAARIGARVMLLTQNMDHIAQMSCNPAIGGIGKGQVVCEIDALGGEMGRNTDATRIQFRMLNQSKGAAVWSPRAQADKLLFQKRMKHVLERDSRIFVHQAEAARLLHDKNRITGVLTAFGDEFHAETVVICSGTFLRGKLHYGLKQYSGGRSGDAASDELSRCIQDELELTIDRLKTGTPPRIVAHSMDFAEMQEQDSDPDGSFTHWPDLLHPFRSIAPDDVPQRACYVTHTTDATRKAVLDNIERAPMYNGTIEGKPTRYCPSFEDKIMRFEGKSHHVYVEPEGSFTEEYYLNGISTSLPIDVQWAMVRSLPGFARAEISRYAYAIEYDIVMPHQLNKTLATIKWPNLFFAGQVNGTTGYEEAAGQGLVAGANAALIAAGREGDALILGRDQAYIGVMIDDLVSKDIVEPYRLFTSRAEYRLSLRQDNATRRLSKLAHELCLLSYEKYKRVEEEERQIVDGIDFLKTTKGHGGPLWDRFRKKQAACNEFDELRKLSAYAQRQIEIEAHYEGYIKMERTRAENLNKLDAWKIPAEFEYAAITGLRKEAEQKLSRLRPDTLAQAARIDGVTPAEIALLQVHLKRGAAQSSSS